MIWQKKFKKHKKRFVTALAALVVFVTTYALIIPAITIDQERAEEEPGFVLEEDNSDFMSDEEFDDEEFSEFTDDEFIDEEESESMTQEEESEETWGEEETEVLMPEMTLKKKIGEVTITAEVSEDSLPEGTRLEVTEVEDTETLELIETAVDEDIKIDHVAAFDIRFLSPEGEEIEPEKPVKVSMVSQEVKEAEDTVVVHLDDDTQKSEIIEQVDEVTDEDEVAFESDSFSVYGFVFTQKLTKTVLTEEGDTYIVTVHLDENSGIPEDAELVVSELTEGSESYEEHLTQAREALNMDSEAPVRFARFFDIEIQKDGEKLEPATPAKVELTYVDPLKLEDEENLSVVHFADSGIEVIDDLKVSDDEKKITYEQESFSVTGTIIQGTLGNGQQGMLIVRDKNGDQYIILSDGTLEPVDEINNTTFTTDNPMIWKYGWDTYYHPTRAYDFNSDDVASDFYYSYINAKEEDGIADDDYTNINPQQRLNNPPNPDKQGKTIGDYEHRSMWPASATILENHHMRNKDPENGQYYYIGVERGTDGKLVRITGRNSEADAAEIYLAETSVPSSDPGRNRVNHIDISIKGNVSITYPLARGVTYYYEDGSTYTPTERTTVTLSQEVGIMTDDMRKATITAFKKDPATGVKTPMDEAFYITGYSANAATDMSTEQVRIEGSFLVSTNNTNDYERKKEENRVYYSVEASKPITFNVTDSNGRQLYDEKHQPITVTTNVNLSASFDYWDSRNECPGIWRFDPNGWQRGAIVGWGNSGMDFRMGADENLNTLEVIKMVEDKDGNLIEMAAGTKLDHDFNIYKRSNGQWHLIDTKTAEVSEQGIGFTSDYGVPDGKYVIRENTDTIPDTITDKNGDTWIYTKTYFETEGRNRRDWSNKEGLYESTHGEVGASDRDIQFTCHNIYVKKTSVEVEKKWYQDGEEVTAPDNAEITITLGRYVKDDSDDPVDPIDPDDPNPPTPARVKANIDIYQSTYGHRTWFSDNTSFYAGQTLHITLNKQKQATVSYTVNNGEKITLPVEQGNGAREDYTFDVVVPADGIVNIALDDAWSDVQNIRVMASDSANSVRRAPSAIRTENITVTTDGQPPEGYHVDTSFVQPVSLSNAAGWSRSVRNLDSKDAKGNDYLYYIAKIEEKNVPAGTVAQVQEPLTTTGDEPLKVHNILPTPKVDISFGKAWYGADSQPVTEWPTDVEHISVTLRRYYMSGEEPVYDEGFNRVIEVNPKGGDGYSVEQKDTGEYWFTVKELDQYFIPSEGTKVNWIYTIAENELTNYHIKYRTSDGAEASGATYVTDGGTIENHLNVYSLPHTGGTGTLIYTLTGGILFILGLLVLLYRLFRERRLEC